MINERRAGDVTSAPWMAQRPNSRQDGVLREERHLHGAAYADNPDAFDFKPTRKHSMHQIMLDALIVELQLSARAF